MSPASTTRTGVGRASLLVSLIMGPTSAAVLPSASPRTGGSAAVVQSSAGRSRLGQDSLLVSPLLGTTSAASFLSASARTGGRAAVFPSGRSLPVAAARSGGRAAVFYLVARAWGRPPCLFHLSWGPLLLHYSLQLLRVQVVVLQFSSPIP